MSCHRNVKRVNETYYLNNQRSNGQIMKIMVNCRPVVKLL